MCILCSCEREHGLHLGPDTFATSQHLALARTPPLRWCFSPFPPLFLLLVLFGQLPAAAAAAAVHLCNVTARWMASSVKTVLSWGVFCPRWNEMEPCQSLFFFCRLYFMASHEMRRRKSEAVEQNVFPFHFAAAVYHCRL